MRAQSASASRVWITSGRPVARAAAMALLVAVTVGLPLAIVTWQVESGVVPWAIASAALELANELGLPLVIHTREADHETFPMLERARVPVVLHCFSSPQRLDEAVERGYLMSFAGNVTYPKAVELQAAAARVPEQLLLAETDSPYLAPVPFRGRRNTPANVMHTLAFLASLRGTGTDELAAAIERNAAAVFRLP